MQWLLAWFRLVLARLKKISGTNFILLLSIAVGTLAGLSAVALKAAVHFVQASMESQVYRSNTLHYLYYVGPLVGVVATWWLARYVLRDKLQHGITQLLYVISKNFSFLPFKRTYTFLATSTLTVGLGGSVGLESPIVGTGAAIGANLGKWARLNYRTRTLLIGCGAAGAIAGIFNSPIAGVIFVIEVILTDIAISQFIPLLIASVSGAVVAQMLLPGDILFSFELKDPFVHRDIPYYMLLGVLCGFCSLYFVRVSFWIEDQLRRLSKPLQRACVGGGLLSILTFLLFPLYGEGYNIISDLLNGGHPIWIGHGAIYGLLVWIAVLLLKPIASSLTLGSGGSGGIFAPALFVGALLGFLFAELNNLLPLHPLSISNFALVGMCGLLSGVLHAPLTAIFLIAEITASYTLFIPLMIVSAIAYSTILYYEPHSFYTKPLFKKGGLLFARSHRDQQLLNAMVLSDLVEENFICLPPDASMDALVDAVRRSRRNLFPVVDLDTSELHGVITLDNIREIIFDEQKRKQSSVAELAEQPPATIDWYEAMDSVMNKFETTQAWNLPVLRNGRYAGIVSKASIFNAYRTHITGASASPKP